MADDLTTKQIWFRLREGWANMAEIFEELICNFDTGESTMEVTTVLLVGWAIFCVLLVALGRYVNQRFLRPQITEGSVKTEPATTTAEVKTTAQPSPSAAPTPKTKSPTPTPSSPTPAISIPGSKSKVTKRKSAGEGKEAVFTSRILDGWEGIPPTGEKQLPTSPARSAAPSAPVLRDVPVPFATGSDKDSVRWVNALLRWLYTDPTPTPELHEKWIAALNDVAKKLAAENGVQLRIQEITPESSLPTLTNVMADPSPNENVINILCDIEASTLGFILHVTRQMGDDFWSTDYTCNVDTLSGPLSVVCEPDLLKGTVHFDCRPKIKLSLIPNPRTKMPDPLDEQALQTLVSEIVSNTIWHTSVDVDVANYSTCPRFARTQMVAEPIIPIHYDSMIPTSVSMSPKKPQKKGKRLFVKVIKAHNLGSDKGCVAPICIAELDEPSQKHTTGISEGISPFWDEHFLFNLSDDTGEILFELWDKNPKEGKERFLGLGIVSVDDLLKNPSQRQIIPLQSRPYEGDDISGSLTVEFLFMEAADVPKIDREKPPRPPPPSPSRVVDTNRTVTTDGTVITTTTTIRKSQPEGVPEEPDNTEIDKGSTSVTVSEQDDAIKEIIVNGEDTLTSTALRELSKPQPTSTTTDKSTLIIHSVQREAIHPSLKPKEGDNLIPDRYLPLLSETSSSIGENDRSRPKERKSFMSTLKKRLSFRNKRSRSVDQQPESSSRESSASRSASVDRAQSLPGSRGENLSGRSSLSEVSGVSSSSAQTYIDEASMLVVETVENGITKHYLIPGALASRSKWRKKGTKLHIYNDHTFVAKHLPSNIVCEVCSKPFIRRIGKQGYECRDCQMKCHKPCHVRTDVRCPSSTVGSMELIRDWWEDIPSQRDAQRRLSLKSRIKRLGHGLEPIPSNDMLPTNKEEAEQITSDSQKKKNSEINSVH